jgi:hypothetical protein
VKDNRDPLKLGEYLLRFRAKKINKVASLSEAYDAHARIFWFGGLDSRNTVHPPHIQDYGQA